MYVRAVFSAHGVYNIILADSNGMMGSMMQDLAFAIPGVDEAMGFAEIMKYASSPRSPMNTR
jgi:anion-transporting  ArsA/GET3 family ATPase